MAHQPFDRRRLMSALERLDALIEGPAHLIIGGGAAMIAAYDFPLATRDVDATTARGSLRLSALEGAARRVAKELDLEPDWLNPYFETYTAVLPADYRVRLRRIYEGARLQADALGPEDLLVMKCFAARDKDRPHARRLLRVAEDLAIVDRQLAHLAERGYPGAEKAADYFDDLRDEEMS